MKTHHLIMAAAIIPCLVSSCSGNGSKPENDTSLKEQTFKIGLGWNLGNQLDANQGGTPGETLWGNAVVTQATIDSVKAAGFSTIRIPVTWGTKIGAAPAYAIDSAWLSRVSEIVGYAEKAGLNAIINIHHDGADSRSWLNIKDAPLDSTLNAGIKACLGSVWAQIARNFADKGEFLMFESMNEIHDGRWGWGDNKTDGGKQYRAFNEWQQVFVDSVRAQGGTNTTRYLGIPTYCTNTDLGEYLELPSDPTPDRMLVAVHLYEPFEYTLENKYTQWGHTADKDKAHPVSDEKTLIAELDKAASLGKRLGVPVYIGETGCVRRDNERDEKFRLYYLEYLAKAAADRDISIIYWDNGYADAGRECSGLFDRATGAFLNDGGDVVKAMHKGFCSTDSAYTIETVYASAPTE